MNKQDGTHYECAGLSVRFALGWLARAEENLRSTRRISRSPHHHELEQKAKLLQHDLLDLAVKLFQAARRIGVTGPHLSMVLDGKRKSKRTMDALRRHNVKVEA